MANECELLNCVFAHGDEPFQLVAPDELIEDAPLRSPNKRIKLRDGSGVKSGPAKPADRPFVGRLARNLQTHPTDLDDGQASDDQRLNDVVGRLTSVKASKAPVSPPPLKRPLQSQSPDPATAKGPPHKALSQAPIVKGESNEVETLNPRMMKKPPAPHTSRSLYLKKLHEYMKRLNDLAATSNDPATKKHSLNEAELVKLALDEEETIALENFSVYGNMMKLRMVAYSKMSIEQWKADRSKSQTEIEADAASNKVKGERDLSTGLLPAEEIQVLPQLFADQNILSPHGLVIKPPTEAEVVAAREGVEMSKGFEKCDRCGSRFQVFPERREDGALTSGGTCTHHHGRIAFPNRDGGNFTGTSREKRYSCCNEPVGSTGCTTSETHVFKVNDSKRLASIFQFERTPENPNAPQDRAVSFDCEMGYTVYGMEIIRLTAVAWPTGEDLIDVLVKPIGAILDLNTRYSGVSFKDFSDASPYDEASSPIKSSQAKGKGLRFVESPKIARDLIFGLISPSTPLIGHAIDNDLNVTRIVHPTIIDTVLLFPHRAGLPFRPALRTLAKERLRRVIQTGGAAGHDSREDAIATGDLVRLAVGSTWRKLEQSGWTFENGKLVEPTNPSSNAHALKELVQEEAQQVKDFQSQEVVVLDY